MPVRIGSQEPTMKRLPILLVTGVVLAIAAAAFGLLRPTNSDVTPPLQPAAAAARTSLPGLVAATGEPTLPSLNGLRPQPKTVIQAPGPFDDRFTLSRLRLNGDSVTGSATVTSDVSDILEFEAVAGFYDATGALLGTGRFVYHLDEAHDHAPKSATGTPSEVESFTIAVPKPLVGKAVSAAVGVPVLVNE